MVTNLDETPRCVWGRCDAPAVDVVVVDQTGRRGPLYCETHSAVVVAQLRRRSAVSA